jgi:hypothetical protein
MMEEITNALPSVERKLLHLELEQLSSGKSSATIFSSNEGVAFDSGTNNLMSWERLTPRPATNGTVPALIQQRSPFGESPTPERSSLRRFDISDTFSGRPGSNPRLAQIGQGIQASKIAPQSRHTTAAPPMLQSTPRFSPLHDPARFLASSSSGPSGLRFTPNRPSSGLFGTHHATQADGTPMDDSAPSANFARNAFYEPPVTNGVKRPFGHDEPRLAPTIPTQPSPPPPPSPPQPVHSRHDDDIDMYSEGDSGLHDVHNPINGTEAPTATEHPFSIFTQTGKAAPPPRQHKRAEPQRKMPPGAFGPDSDEEGIAEKTRRSKDRTRASSPPSKTQPSRTTKSRKPTKEANLSRTIPGALMAEEEEDEEADRMGPLPSSTQSKRPARKGRISRTSSIASDQADSKAPRRSSRLMNAPSTASSSPEPPPKKAPVQGKRTSRGSATAATTSKSSSRKKR